MDNHLEMLSKEFCKAYSDVDKNRVTWEQRREKEIEKYVLFSGKNIYDDLLEAVFELAD